MHAFAYFGSRLALFRRGVWAFAVLLLCFSSGCRTVGYYAQAVRGQYQILEQREPIERLLADPETLDSLAARLRLSKRLLAFAETELAMPAKGAYETYADLGRRHAVYVLHAAPRLSREPKRWWYPVVGAQEYRGYFDFAGARSAARELERRGYETWINGVEAYSTLGRFRDPLLNTFIERGEGEFAELIFHELAHVTHYFPGDTPMNESLAEAVAREGVKRWFEATGRPSERLAYERQQAQIDRARAAIQRCAADLDLLFDSDLPSAQKRHRKREHLQRLILNLDSLGIVLGGSPDDSLGTGPTMNNARLNSLLAYEQHVPHFQALLQKCDGDFAKFWRHLRADRPHSSTKRSVPRWRPR